jgi:hypothetical protein
LEEQTLSSLKETIHEDPEKDIKRAG